MTTFLKDSSGKPEGVIRPLGGGREVLCDLGGRQLAFYDPQRDGTYRANGQRIGNGNRLAGLVGGSL